ncbi:MAG: hypothetical protein EXS41_04310, partial [Opitutaceae bacterium]|nr:hypothetical protein [Opitutaceae bacterium]
MTTLPPSPCATFRLLLRPFSVLSAFAILCFFTSAARAADGATISGSVNNSATRNLLPGARVEIAALGRSALADNTGRYVLTD